MTLPDETERLRRQKTRSVAIGLGLGLLVVVFYVATIVRLGPNALRKDGPAPAQATSAISVEKPDCKKAGTCP